MTTPERLRRRQLLELRALIILGVLLLILGVTQIVTTRYFRDQDDAQRACIADKFSALASALTVRGELSKRDGRASRVEGRASRWESMANQDLYDDIVTGGDAAAFAHAYARYSRRIGVVNDERARAASIRARVRTLRDENPIPAFPEGTCDASE